MYYQNYKDRLFDNKDLFNIKMHTKNSKSQKRMDVIQLNKMSFVVIL